MLQPQRRWQSSQSARGPQPRKRFYKQVGVAEVSPPWETIEDNTRTSKLKTVDNPISAGVDGTQSASGVTGHLPKPGNDKSSRETHIQQLKERLTPRCTTLAATNMDASQLDQLAPPAWYSVTLDGRTLRTPTGQILSVPSRILAWAIAAEWDAQLTQIKPVQMPIMTLVCTTLDQTASHMQLYQDTALNFLPTDTTCYWADPTEDRILHRHQESAWKELHGFIEKEWNHRPAMAMGAQEGMLMSRRNAKTGIRGLPHPPSLYEACVDWTRGLDAWHLTALNAVTAESKSFLVAYAVLHPSSPFSSHGGISGGGGGGTSDAAAKAIRAARVEEEFQIESWGLVEGQHDYDRLNCSVQLRSSKLLAKCVLEQS